MAPFQCVHSNSPFFITFFSDGRVFFIYFEYPHDGIFHFFYVQGGPCEIFDVKRPCFFYFAKNLRFFCIFSLLVQFYVFLTTYIQGVTKKLCHTLYNTLVLFFDMTNGKCV
uniref:Uncharacterized protein n=1 Tax=Cacopsylla melanoneura TaxID=428564 RepID=A0A8D8VU33_9HEMI